MSVYGKKWPYKIQVNWYFLCISWLSISNITF
jgi:hypothetical protein